MKIKGKGNERWQSKHGKMGEKAEVVLASPPPFDLLQQNSIVDLQINK